MKENYAKRTLKQVDIKTGMTGRTAELRIGESVCSHDFDSGKVLQEPGRMTHWYVISRAGDIIDGIIRLEDVSQASCISAMTSSRNPEHPLFIWLRELAEELGARGIPYEPLLRKGAYRGQHIIDALRI